ncbi:MAG: hypothetical protein ACI4NM_02235 [Bullifex sp.]
MKRLLLFPLMITALFSLSASEYRESNVLMQEKAVIGSLTGSGYELEINGDEKVLYLDGAQIRRVSEKDGVRTVTEGNRSVTYSGVAQPVRIVTENGESTVEELYEYSADGVLKRVITVTDGVTSSVTEYDYSPSSGLTAFRQNDYSDPMYIGENSYTFLLDGDDVKVSLVSDLILRESGSEGYTSDGDTITVRDGDDVLLYSSETGLLMEMRYSDGRVTEYTYSGRELISEESIKGQEVTLTEYFPGMTRITVKEGEETRRVREKSDGVISETVYRNSEPYAIVTYDSDGKRVLEVKVL